MRRFSLSGLVMMAGMTGLLLGEMALAVSPDEKDPKVIMDAVESRATGDKVTSRLAMTIRDDSGRERKRALRSWSMEFAEGTKQLMFFESPADVANTGLLTVDYDAGSKTDDQWLYLPSLRKSTRISSGDKSGSFMGSDLSYADMTKADPKDYQYVLVKASAKVGGEDCWVIEARPVTDKAKKETGYLKTMSWISKTKLMPLQAKIWITEGRKVKQLKFGKIREVEGIWIAHKISARTLRNDKEESRTTIEFNNFKINDPAVKEDLFSQRRLEQGL